MSSRTVSIPHTLVLDAKTLAESMERDIMASAPLRPDMFVCDAKTSVQYGIPKGDLVCVIEERSVTHVYSTLVSLGKPSDRQLQALKLLEDLKRYYGD